MINICDLSNKIFLVTGASAGIGREVSISISRMGGRVLLTGRNKEGLTETLQQMENPDTHIVEPFDLSRIDEIGTWVNRVVNKYYVKFNGMVYAAGKFLLKPLLVSEYQELRDIMDLNYFAAVYLLKSMAQKSICATGSSFVFISSVSGESGEPGLLGYGASKAALNSAVRTASLEYARSGYRINAISPASVETDMLRTYLNQLDEQQVKDFKKSFPLGIGKPEDVANMAVYLLSDSSKWITGTVVKVDGGYTRR